MEIVQALKGSGLLLKRISETIENEVKEQKGGYFSMLLGTIGASLLGSMLAGKEIIRAVYRSKRKEILKAGYGCKLSSIKKRF